MAVRPSQHSRGAWHLKHHYYYDTIDNLSGAKQGGAAYGGRNKHSVTHQQSFGSIVEMKLRSDHNPSFQDYWKE